MALYDAFISYSHAKDKAIASALQSVVQKLGKPWYRRRSLRAFRDDTSLSATPSLWPSIEQALGNSRFLILLASPEAAVSPWVDKEVAYWLEHKSANTLLIALTGGDLAWDTSRGGFSFGSSTPLPPSLQGRLESEPKWVDLRAYRDGANPRDSKFAELAADFAAAVHGVPKEDLLSRELRQQRKALTLAWSAAASLLVLAGAAVWQWKTAADQRDRAERTLAAATEAANGMIFELANEFRDRTGMPIDLVRKILDRAQNLQQKLTASGETAPELRYSEVVALLSLVDTLLTQGDTEKAGQTAERARAIAADLVAIDSAHPQFQAILAQSYHAIGSTQFQAGRRDEALVTLQKSLDIDEKLAIAYPDDTDRQRQPAVDYDTIGYMLLVTGKSEEALDTYRKALAITEKLAAAEPDTLSRQYDLSIIHNKIGDVQLAVGERDQALATYQKALSLTEAIVGRDVDNASFQEHLTVCQINVGDVLVRLGRYQDALLLYRKSLDLRTKLAPADPGNAQRQRDVAANDERIGNAEAATGNLQGAYDAYQDSLAIIDKVAAADPSNAQRQRERGIAREKIGDVLLAAGQADKAVEAYRASLEIREKLLAEDPSNTMWLRDAAVLREKTGAALSATSQHDEAIALYHKSIAARETLIATDPKNVDWQTELASCYVNFGDALKDAGQTDAALENYRKGLALATKPGSGEDFAWMEIKGMADARIGDALLAEEKREEALASYHESLATRERLTMINPVDSKWRLDLFMSLVKLAEAGDTPRAQYGRALTILRALDADGSLNDRQKGWIEMIEQRIAALPGEPSASNSSGAAP